MSSKLRVGFFPPSDKGWMGGVNYYKNLFFALNKYLSAEIEVVIFLPRNHNSEITSVYTGYVNEIILLDVLTRKSTTWFLSKIESRIIGTNRIFGISLKKSRIDIVSHSYITRIPGIKSLSWIPDFQHVHLPNMFSTNEIKKREKMFKKLIKESDGVILSSYDALNDFENFSPKFKNKGHVLQFVSQPSKVFFEILESDKIKLQLKYNLPEKYYYIPNQFWKHKNHLLAFEAIKILFEKGMNPCLVCTGSLEDIRDPEYINLIKDFIHNNKLENNIKLLGLVNYEDVFSLMKFSEVVINPSLFEGWSSTVEECKSIGKKIVLSNLNVHLEQIPDGIFFDKYDPESLATVLELSEFNDISASSSSVEERTKFLANQFLHLLRSF
ncbi:glycosyltransferase family 4 protein [Marinomonas colpomeniae]|uniref:Glycosyltransferase family 4 protein n=1 Tax=Marinomonas colpomeniae TaxID=2774408 RepID=A0ABR8NYL2_9GAMM|nr:glycosyltransferase family 1 protein [Marinomonas colpomeniae]MBD5771124.1 glycosyltransferase family 4 protein [Marinomonas colpomeniae]